MQHLIQLINIYYIELQLSETDRNDKQKTIITKFCKHI